MRMNRAHSMIVSYQLSRKVLSQQWSLTLSFHATTIMFLMEIVAKIHIYLNVLKMA